MANINASDDFKVIGNEFTVFVIGKTYFSIRGKEYLKQFLNKENWIASDQLLEKRIKRLLSWIHKNTPNIAELVQNIIDSTTKSNKLGLIEIIVSLSKLFSATEHVAVGPDVINPIIIEEEKVTKKNLTQYVTMHEKSRYRPVIIILLKDDDFNRAKTLLSNCPNGMNVKMIQNDGKASYYKVINKGAKNVEEFLDSYARQCFSTCSNTEHSVLLSDNWANDYVIKQYSPTIFHIRSTFIREEKLGAARNIDWLDTQLSLCKTTNSADEYLKNSFSCMNKLFKVYCYDSGGKDLNDALYLANSLDNDILKAHVYRYSHFFDCSRKEKQDLLQLAEDIFTKYDIYDHTVYSRNNKLIHQFSMNKIFINDFCELEDKARYDTPGLSLMAHIVNNVGVAYLFEHFLDNAIEAFDRGLNTVQNNHIQELALKSNKIIAETLNLIDFNEREARKILNTIFGAYTLGMSGLPYLTAQFALNIIASALISRPTVAIQLLNEYPILPLVQSAFNTNIMGTGSMIKQLEVLSIKYNHIQLIEKLRLPQKRTPVSGIRLDFICRYGLNPFFFNTWL